MLLNIDVIQSDNKPLNLAKKPATMCTIHKFKEPGKRLQRAGDEK